MLAYGPIATGQTNPHYRGVWNSGTAYAANDIVLYPGPVAGNTGPSYTFVAVNPSTNQPPATFTTGTPTNSYNVLSQVYSSPGYYWQLQPWSTNAVKANVNTATFRELFRAFWCVMAGNPSNATPFGTTGVDAYNIYDPTAPTAGSPLTGNPQAMFRSPLRDPIGTTRQMCHFSTCRRCLQATERRP